MIAKSYTSVTCVTLSNMRTPKGLRLTYRPLRLDDEVWAELQKMKANGTINEGLREVLFCRRRFAVPGATELAELDELPVPARHKPPRGIRPKGDSKR